MFRRISLMLLGCLFVSLLAELGSAAEWKAGKAKVNITPKTYMWMSGYGGRNKPAEGKLTDLWAKALAIEDGQGGRVVLITADLIGVDRGISVRVGKQLKEKYGLERSQVAICTSHTHTGPAVGDNLRAMYFFDSHQQDLVDAYTKTLEGNLVSLVGQALKAIKPASLSWTSGKVTFGVNRRNNPEGDVPKLRAEGKLKGPVDHDLPVLAVHDKSGNLETVVCGYACHSTVLSFYQWSGDWPGFAQIEMEKMGVDVMAMVWAGCGADQNPLPRRKVELAKDYGKQIADGVERAFEGGLKPIEGKLGTSYKEIGLGFSHLPSRGELEKELKSKNRFTVGKAKVLIDRIDKLGKLPETYPYPVQTWKLGNGPTFIILGGEVVVDYALRLKTELDENSTWVAGYSNDVMAYIPSLRVLKEGGYEGGGSMVYYGLPSPWKPDVEKLIVAEVHRQVKSLGVKK